MPLPSDEAGFRSLEPKCASPSSSDSKRTVVQLSSLSLESLVKKNILVNAVLWGLPNIVRCALEAKISPNSRGDVTSRPILVEAAFIGSARILKLLLDAGADLNLVDFDGCTAVNAAAAFGQLECLQILLAAGADAKKAGALGLTPLMNAILRRRTECARALLPASDLRATNRVGRSAFHSCVTTANEECFELLLPLMSDADLEQRTVPGRDERGHNGSVFHETALHLACQGGQQQMARALLKRDANRMPRDSLQRTPLMWAADGHLSCCVLLVGQPGRRKMSPAEVNAADVNGSTALHLAAGKSDCEKICGFLLEAGARLDAKLPSGHTPLMVAQHFQPTNAALHALLSGQGPAQLPGTVCDHCGKTAAQASVSSLKGCAQCHAARYCGAACSAAAWPGHKKACRARAKELEEAAEPRMIPLSVGAAGQAAAGPSQS